MLGRKKTQGKYDFVPEEYGEEEPWAEAGAEDPEDYDPEEPGAGEPWGTEEDPEDYGDAPAEKPEKPEKHSIF
ncbi:MAG: hypothetical protein IKD50_04205, partial [Clostridia bacterium]|nr:hypothetical protein [Clostridia bacterium]